MSTSLTITNTRNRKSFSSQMSQISMKLLIAATALGLGACASSEEKTEKRQQTEVTSRVERHNQENQASQAAANKQPNIPGSSHHDDMRADILGTPANNQISIRLENEVENAKAGAATVIVDPKNFKLVEANRSGQDSNLNQGHLHYRIDNNPSVATTATKLSFHDLLPGQHTITVLPANSGHQPAGPAQRLTVTIPQGNEKYGEQ